MTDELRYPGERQLGDKGLVASRRLDNMVWSQVFLPGDPADPGGDDIPESDRDEPEPVG